MLANEETVRPKLARFRPKLLDALQGYSKEKFLKDLMAGLTVGVVALSLCIGLGAASGVNPKHGLYAGIFGGFLVSALGGSRVQVGGPAGAFVGLLAVMSAKYGLPDLLLCTMMAGVILFVMGLLKMGVLIKFVPQPITVGFTCGIAVTLLTTQIQPFFGLHFPEGVKEPAEFLPKIIALAKVAGTVNWPTVALSLVSLVILWKWPVRLRAHVPGSIVVVALGTTLAAVAAAPWAPGWFAAHLGVDNVATIGSKFGEIPRGLPAFSLPRFDWRHLNDLVMPAFTIAVLCAIESLLSAVVSDGLIDDQHDSNQELMGQGVANCVAPLFGALPVTGVIARTATNIRNGAQTPLAGMIHAVFLLGVLLVAAPLARHIPLAALGAVLISVGWRMGEWGELRRLKKRPPGDVAVFLLTFALTVFLDLPIAVTVGMLLACFLFIKRVTETTQVQSMTGDARKDAHQPGHGAHEELHEKLPEGVIIYRVFGALLFGAADKLNMVLRRGIADTRVVIFHMTAVSVMDATALDRLENLHEKLARAGRHLILCGPHTQAYYMMAKAGFLDEVGEANVMPDLPSSVARAKTLLAASAPAKPAPAAPPKTPPTSAPPKPSAAPKPPAAPPPPAK
ncbi:MAG: STAS domain-containing protein [Opitutaceae bacterium]|jgi:SulP family sulfate permease|nr:STAS domain-containing protein [Opitutaceae bacterium]